MKQNIFFKKVRVRIDFELKKFFSREISRARYQNKILGRVVNSIGEFTMRSGAKRIRGLLVVLGFLSKSSNTITADIIKVAAAYEILHSYLLIHDDIIDQDVQRRGRPTVHILLKELAPKTLSSSQKAVIGRDLGIIAGDCALLLSQRLLLSTHFSDAQKNSLHEYLNEVLQDTCSGQVLDIISLPQQLPSAAVQEWRYLQKTARYTIEAPFMVGVRCANARVQTAQFKKFARDVGLGFQLADDVHNIFGTSHATRQSDIRSGKVTYLMTYAMQSKRHKAAILQILRKKKRSPRDVSQLRKLLIESGGYKRAITEIKQRYQSARTLIIKASFPSIVTEQLLFLVNALEARLPREY